nr:retrovirus-related Pol polyprotein LINE-1 [Tanacetum cinerariifolium]
MVLPPEVEGRTVVDAEEMWNRMANTIRGSSKENPTSICREFKNSYRPQGVMVAYIDASMTKETKAQPKRAIKKQNEKGKRRIWKEYLSVLFNEKRRDQTKEMDNIGANLQNNCYCSRFRHAKVKKALRKMGRNKGVWPNEISIEAWRCLGDEGVRVSLDDLLMVFAILFHISSASTTVLPSTSGGNTICYSSSESLRRFCSTFHLRGNSWVTPYLTLASTSGVMRWAPLFLKKEFTKTKCEESF